MAIYEPMTLKGKGGALPQYQGGNQAYAPGKGVSARIDPSYIKSVSAGYDAINKGIGNLAGAIDQSGRKLAGAIDNYGRQKAQEYQRIYMERMNEALYNKDNGLLNLKGEDAFGVEKRIREKQIELKEQVLGDKWNSWLGIGNYFDAGVAQYNESTYTKGLQHSSQQYQRWVPAQHLAQAELYTRQAQQCAHDPNEAQGWMDGAARHYAMAMSFQGKGTAEIAAGLEKMSHDFALNQVQTAIANKDFDGAERLLNGDSLSSRNLAKNNFGNIKTLSGGYATYATRQDGIMAVGERVLRYNNAPDRGWHADNIYDMVSIYAPKGDGGNDPVKYSIFLQKRLGMWNPRWDASWKDLNGKAQEAILKRKVNFRDPEVLATLIQSIPVQEHGVGRTHIGRDEALAAANDLLAGAKPRTVKGGGSGPQMGRNPEVDNPEGLVEPGNIDLYNRNVYHGPDGSTATVRSMTVSEGDRHYVIPTVIDHDGTYGPVDPDTAYEHFRKTGQHMGAFSSLRAAEAYSKAVHDDHEKRYGGEPQRASEGPSRASGGGSLTSLETAAFRNQIERGRKAQQKEQEALTLEGNVQRAYDSVAFALSKANGATLEEKTALMTKYTADLPQAVQKEVRSRLGAVLQEEEKQRQANVVLDIAKAKKVIVDDPKRSYYEKMGAIRNAQISDESKQTLLKFLNEGLEGKGNEAQSAKDLLDLYNWYDRQIGGVSEEAMYAAAYQTNMNSKDFDKWMSYHGKRGMYPFGRASEVIDSVYGKNKISPQNKLEMYESMLQQMGDQRWTESQVKDFYRQFNDSGIRTTTWYISGRSTLAERFREGHPGLFRPKVSPLAAQEYNRRFEDPVNGYPGWTECSQEARDIIMSLQALVETYPGIKPEVTEDEAKVLKKENMKWLGTTR